MRGENMVGWNSLENRLRKVTRDGKNQDASQSSAPGPVWNLRPIDLIPAHGCPIHFAEIAEEQRQEQQQRGVEVPGSRDVPMKQFSHRASRSAARAIVVGECK